ncbi:MAG TPA: hypothetical protein VFT50_08995 [Baekduia sp.]|nr:hypothetical protein [Baekduia sp.]
MTVNPRVKVVFFAGVLAHYLTDGRDPEILWFLGVWLALLAAEALFGVGVDAWRAGRKAASKD